MKTTAAVAAELYSERKSIAAQRKEIAEKVSGMILSPRGQRRVRFAEETEAKNGPLSTERRDYLTLGHRLGSQVNQFLAIDRANAELAVAHYELHAGEYHQMALDEAKADGVQINFGGEIALNVNVLIEPTPQQLPDLTLD